MKKILSFLAIALTCQFAATAQTNYEAIHALRTEAKELVNEKKFAQAADKYMEITDLVKNCSNELEQNTYITCLTMASIYYYKSKEFYEKGFLAAQTVLQADITEKQLSDIVNWYTRNGRYFAIQCRKAQNFDRCHAVIDEILPYSNDEFKQKLINDKAFAYELEATDCEMHSQSEKAYELYTKALAEYEKIRQTNDAAKMLYRMASCLSDLLQYTKAISTYDQVYDKSQSVDNKELMIRALNGKRKIYQSLGDKKNASQIALSISQIAVSDDNLLSLKYEIFADNALEINDFYVAENYYLKSVALKGQTINDIGSKYILYHRLRDAMLKAKDYEKAVEYENLADDIIKSTELNDIDAQFDHLQALTNIFCQSNNENSALQYARQLVEFVNNNSDKPFIISLAYIELARTLQHFNHTEKAIEAYRNADNAIASQLPQNDEFRMAILAIVSGLQTRVGNYSDSEKGYKMYYQWTKSVYGDESMKTCTALYYLANSEAFNNKKELSEKHYVESIEAAQTEIKTQLRYVSSTERESYWNSISEMLWNMTSFAVKNQTLQDSFTETAYNALLFSKSLLLSSEISMFEIIQKYGTQQDINDFTTLAELRLRINELEKNPDQNKDEISTLSVKGLWLDRKLTNRSSEYEDFTNFLDIKFTDIKEHLSDNQIVIDYTDFQKYDDEHIYAAFILKHNEPFPILVKVFESTELDNLLETNSLYELFDSGNSAQLLKLLWQPIAQYIPEGAQIFYVPSGILHKIAIESIPLNDNELLGDKYSFSRLTSAREVLKNSDTFTITKNSKATLFGGLNYNMNAQELLAESKKYNINSASFAYYSIRGAASNKPFDFLENSLIEVNEVANTLKTNKLKTTVFTGNNGTEDAFLNINGSAPQLMLISTHGFYYTPDKAKNVKILSNYSDAMSLSGLIMSGANIAWSGRELPEGVRSGILTAEKISAVDLSGLDLVVLSACQTGLGQTSHEGVFGLQRAFKKAGAQTIIMTLWSVSDVATKDFITTFFTQLAACEWKKHEAFESTKRIIRSKYPDPYYWAAFVMLD